MNSGCCEFKRRYPAIAQQHSRQEQPRGQITHAHRLAREGQQRTAQMPAALTCHQQHFKLFRAAPRVDQVLDQHRFWSALQQTARHGDAVFQ
ncbi:hypothetical protein D3C80_2045260 [compost metagenome]